MAMANYPVGSPPSPVSAEPKAPCGRYPASMSWRHRSRRHPAARRAMPPWRRRTTTAHTGPTCRCRLPCYDVDTTSGEDDDKRRTELSAAPAEPAADRRQLGTHRCHRSGRDSPARAGRRRAADGSLPRRRHGSCPREAGPSKHLCATRPRRLDDRQQHLRWRCHHHRAL